MKKELKVPKFKNEKEEREFWAKINLADYFELEDFSSASFPNLKPTSRSISIRLPEYLIVRIKEQANELNVPYQSLMKRYLAKGVLEDRYQKQEARAGSQR
jgi:predicted DNA binding CopG/RHH family protein